MNSLRRDIRNILLSEWDPIGVFGNPHLADEYDSYINAFFDLRKSQLDAGNVEDILRQIEHDLHVDTGHEIRAKVAQSIIRTLRLHA